MNDEGSILLIRCDETKVALGGSVKKRLEAKSMKGSKAMVVTCMCTFPGKNVIFLGTSENTIFALKYQRNENKISMKEQISLWSKYKHVSCISFLNTSEHSRLVAAAGDETYVWDYNSKSKESKLIEIYSPYIVKNILPLGSDSIDAKAVFISAVKILAGRNIMAVGYSTGVLMLWDLLHRELITALLFHADMVRPFDIRSSGLTTMRKPTPSLAIAPTGSPKCGKSDCFLILIVNSSSSSCPPPALR